MMLSTSSTERKKKKGNSMLKRNSRITAYSAEDFVFKLFAKTRPHDLKVCFFQSVFTSAFLQLKTEDTQASRDRNPPTFGP